jgi:two-component system chemotaxis sensor kinase CheA
MNALLEQFIVEAREFLEGIAGRLIDMEERPHDADLVKELFRMVHTLKGNSGLFTFADMTQVLHASEDLMDAVRDGRVNYSRELADRLLEAMDLVGRMLDDVERHEELPSGYGSEARGLAGRLRKLIGAGDVSAPALQETIGAAAELTPTEPAVPLPFDLGAVPEAVRLAAFADGQRDGRALYALRYRPEELCFFKGEDPFQLARTAPGVLWGRAVLREPVGPQQGAGFDCYRCIVDFEVLGVVELDSLRDHFRYVPEQVEIVELPALSLVVVQGTESDPGVCREFAAHAAQSLERGDIDALRSSARSLAELSAPDSWLGSALRWLLVLATEGRARTDEVAVLVQAIAERRAPRWTAASERDRGAVEAGASPGASSSDVALRAAPTVPALSSHARDILRTQQEILFLPDDVPWLNGRLAACAAVLSSFGVDQQGLQRALERAQREGSAAALREWARAANLLEERLDTPAVEADVSPDDSASVASADVGTEARFGRRAEDAPTNRVLKVEQGKVDYLMNLIGEMVVAKNALPYLADRAERQGSGRDLAREIKAQYAVINRIAEEMQDAIMQVRMMPVSVIFQRFPRLVRDIAHKLGKDINLQLEGEQTEADKNVVEALADPLIHLVRNSLDHGVERPEERLAAGKSRTGTVRIVATQESDRVLIEVSDDGRGIDPERVKRKAYEKGLIDEAALARLSDREAINLVFAAGFSTVDKVSDLSGRGVGMDVVRSAMDRVGGTVELRSTLGQGSTVRLSLPLSMAVSHVMIIETDGQIFGVPMESVEETVRVPQSRLRPVKSRLTTVLRERIVPLYSLNSVLGLDAQPRLNDAEEYAALILRLGDDAVGVLVDGFKGVSDVILKPLPGELGKIGMYAGSALLGDGSVLMVLNPKEMFR